MRPRLVDFGKQAAGGTSAPRKVTVSNHSDKTRTITVVRTSAGFGESDDAKSWKPPASCLVQVTFSPAFAGIKLGALIIRVADRDNDSGTLSGPCRDRHQGGEFDHVVGCGDAGRDKRSDGERLFRQCQQRIE